MVSGAERMRRWRQRKRAEGLIVVSVVVPASAAADLNQIAEALRSDNQLELGPLRDRRSGKLRSVKSVLSRSGS